MAGHLIKWVISGSRKSTQHLTGAEAGAPGRWGGLLTDTGSVPRASAEHTHEPENLKSPATTEGSKGLLDGDHVAWDIPGASET